MIPKPSQSKTPTHTSPKQKDRIAHAPYNFVALPKQAQPVDSPVAQVDQSRYDDALLTGQIQCEFETKSPLYTRCLMSPDFFREYGDKALHELTQAQREERAQFYQQHSKPVVPGSSLRGMIRQLVEIISFGKFLDVTDKSLFFRTLDTTSIGKTYGKRMSGGEPQQKGYVPLAKAGYIKRTNSGYTLIPAVAKVDGSDTNCFRVEEEIVLRRLPDLLLPMSQQNGRKYNKAYRWLRKLIWFRPVDCATHTSHSGGKLWFALVEDVSSTKPASDSGWKQGWLIANGWVPSKNIGKHRHWIIADERDDESKACPIGDADIELYREQGAGLTQKINAENFSVLPEKDGEMIPCFYREWFDTQNRKRLAFGHTAMFRLPYEHNPLDLVPELLRKRLHIDLAEKLFGYVGKGKDKGKYKQDALAGRVFFSDAVLAPDQTNMWYSEKPVVPQILSGPKPTSFQLYLTQQQPDDKSKLQHHDSSDTTLRGYKLYWHKGEKPAFEEESNVVNERTWKMRNESGQLVADTQHTLIRPVKAGVKFKFTIRFENLHPVELGALLWAIEPTPLERNRSICHKLGMGKPLGLGSIKLQATLRLDDRVARYKTLFGADGWAQPERTADNYRSRFEDFIGGHIKGDFNESERIKQLRRLMTWEGPSETSYQQIEPNNEFKDRPVLPLPEDVVLQIVQSTRPKKEKTLTRIDSLQDVQVGTQIRVNVISADPDAAFLEPMDKGTAVETSEIEILVEGPHYYREGKSNVLVEVIKIEGGDPVTLFCKPIKAKHPSE
jgi:CRISPR-associated protein (TIGR03986 family)